MDIHELHNEIEAGEWDEHLARLEGIIRQRQEDIAAAVRVGDIVVFTKGRPLALNGCFAEVVGWGRTKIKVKTVANQRLPRNLNRKWLRGSITSPLEMVRPATDEELAGLADWQESHPEPEPAGLADWR